MVQLCLSVRLYDCENKLKISILLKFYFIKLLIFILFFEIIKIPSETNLVMRSGFVRCARSTHAWLLFFYIFQFHFIHREATEEF